MKQVNLVYNRLQLPASYRSSPTFYVSLLKPAHNHSRGLVIFQQQPNEEHWLFHTRVWFTKQLFLMEDFINNIWSEI